MRKIELEQGSEEWLNWRKGLLTATEAPILMGASPYTTPYQGWQRKVGQIPEQIETEPMRRGKRDEPIARESFIRKYEIKMEPCCVESDEYKFIGASLDGLSSCGNYLLEIKSNGMQNHLIARQGFVPEMHFMQMQHQFISLDNTVEKGFYVSYNNGEDVTIAVFPDKEWQEKYLTKAREYWKRVVLFDPPPLSDRDYNNMENEEWWNSRIVEYDNLSSEEEKIILRKAEIKNELIMNSGQQNCRGSGYSLFKRTAKGHVDYKQIPELKEVDLEKYRKPSMLSWVVMKDRR